MPLQKIVFSYLQQRRNNVDEKNFIGVGMESDITQSDMPNDEKD
jgi:hypothetical protein